MRQRQEGTERCLPPGWYEKAGDCAELRAHALLLLFLPHLLCPLACSLYDTCVFICDLFARVVWEREKKMTESKEREARRRKWEMTGGSSWHTALMYVGK